MKVWRYEDTFQPVTGVGLWMNRSSHFLKLSLIYPSPTTSSLLELLADCSTYWSNLVCPHTSQKFIIAGPELSLLCWLNAMYYVLDCSNVLFCVKFCSHLFTLRQSELLRSRWVSCLKSFLLWMIWETDITCEVVTQFEIQNFFLK